MASQRNPLTDRASRLLAHRRAAFRCGPNVRTTQHGRHRVTRFGRTRKFVIRLRAISPTRPRTSAAAPHRSFVVQAWERPLPVRHRSVILPRVLLATLCRGAWNRLSPRYSPPLSQRESLDRSCLQWQLGSGQHSRSNCRSYIAIEYDAPLRAPKTNAREPHRPCSPLLPPQDVLVALHPFPSPTPYLINVIPSGPAHDNCSTRSGILVNRSPTRP